MKKIITLSLLISLSLSAFSQESAGQGSLIVKVTPVTVLRNMWFTVHGEYAITPSVSLALGISPNMVPKSSGLEDLASGYIIDYTKSKSGLSFDPELRWYSDAMMDGFFFGAYSSIRSSSAYLEDEFYDYVADPSDPFGFSTIQTTTIKSVDLKTMVFVVGPQFGWEKLLGAQDKFVFDGYLGIGLKMTNRKYTGSNASDFSSSAGMTPGIGLRGNVSIGYRIK